MKRVMQPKTLKVVMDAIQQLFIVGTLGSLFVFVPLHSRLSAPETASVPMTAQRIPVAIQNAGGEGQQVAWLNPEWVNNQGARGGTN